MDPSIRKEDPDLAGHIRDVIDAAPKFCLVWSENVKSRWGWVSFETGIAFGAPSNKKLMRLVAGTPKAPSYPSHKRWVEAGVDIYAFRQTIQRKLENGFQRSWLESQR